MAPRRSSPPARPSCWRIGAARLCADVLCSGDPFLASNCPREPGARLPCHPRFDMRSASTFRAPGQWLDPFAIGRVPERDAAALSVHAQTGLDLALFSGADERVFLDPETGRTKYGTPRGCAEDEIWFSSSTASAISARGHAAVAATWQGLVSGSETLANCCDEVRNRLTRLFGIEGTQAILAGSGTEAVLISVALARMFCGPRIATIIVGCAETGRSVSAAATGRHFLRYAAFGEVVPGRHLDGLENMDVILDTVEISRQCRRPAPLRGSRCGARPKSRSHTARRPRRLHPPARCLEDRPFRAEPRRNHRALRGRAGPCVRPRRLLSAQMFGRAHQGACAARFPGVPDRVEIRRRTSLLRRASRACRNHPAAAADAAARGTFRLWRTIGLAASSTRDAAARITACGQYRPRLALAGGARRNRALFRLAHRSAQRHRRALSRGGRPARRRSPLSRSSAHASTQPCELWPHDALHRHAPSRWENLST